jgi:hypothetical protein
MLPFEIALDELDRGGHLQMLRAALWGAAFGLGLPILLFLATWAARGFSPVSPVPLAVWGFLLLMSAFGAVLFAGVAGGVLLWRDRQRGRVAARSPRPCRPGDVGAGANGPGDE